MHPPHPGRHPGRASGKTLKGDSRVKGSGGASRGTSPAALRWPCKPTGARLLVVRKDFIKKNKRLHRAGSFLPDSDALSFSYSVRPSSSGWGVGAAGQRTQVQNES